MTLFRKFLILFRALFFFVRSELYIKQAEVIDPRLLVTHIQFPASRSRSLGFGCRSSSAPTTAVRWPSTSLSHPRHLRIVLPAEERVPAPAPRCLRGDCPASRRSAGYNTAPGGQQVIIQHPVVRLQKSSPPLAVNADGAFFFWR